MRIRRANLPAQIDARAVLEDPINQEQIEFVRDGQSEALSNALSLYYLVTYNPSNEDIRSRVSWSSSTQRMRPFGLLHGT